MTNVKYSYETVLVISMNLGEEGIENMINKFQKLIESKATLDNVDKWGKRRLAYMINKETEAYYVLFDFTSDSDFPAELDRIYSLIIRKDS